MRPSLALLLALVGACASALQVERAAIARVSAPASSHEVYEQVWRVRRSAGERLTSLVSSAACQVYVSRGDSVPTDGVVATVRAIADAEQVLHNVASPISQSGGQLRVNSASNTRGYLRMEVVVYGASLEKISSETSGDVVVEDRVLQAERGVSVEVRGSGDVYVDARSPLKTTTLAVKSVSSGKLTLAMSTVGVVSLNASLSGSGDVKVGAKQLTVSNGVIIQSAGSGAVHLAASMWTSPLITIKSDRSGSAVLRGDAGAHADECVLIASGSGDVNMGSVACGDGQVTTTGSGDVTVSVQDVLTCTRRGYADIYYTGQAPRLIAGASVHPAKERTKTAAEEAAWLDTFTLPTRRLSHFMINGGGVFIDDDGDAENGSYNYSEDEEGETSDSDEKRLASTSFLTHLLVIVGIVAVLALIPNRVEAWRRQSQEHTPLLGEEAPVYI